MKNLSLLLRQSFVGLLLWCSNTAFGQELSTLSIHDLPAPARKALNDFVFVEGGTYSHNYKLGVDTLQFLPPYRVTLHSFYIHRFEISVAEYKRFAADFGARAAYDSTCWTRDFPKAFGEPMERNYFWHPEFRQHPMVGITWEQATLYCKWRTKELNQRLEGTPYTVEVRLPTEVEWQYATLSLANDPKEIGEASRMRSFPWDGLFFLEPKDGILMPNCNSGQILTPEGACIMAMHQDGFLYTAPVKSYAPSTLGIYQMAGNVAEWTADNYDIDTARVLQYLDETWYQHQDSLASARTYNRALKAASMGYCKIIKGGSWFDSAFYMQPGVMKIQDPQRASCTVGFRPALVVKGPKKEIKRKER